MDQLMQLGFYHLNGIRNSFGNFLQAIFCSRHDNIELMCHAPSLGRGFEGSAAQHSVDLVHSCLDPTSLRTTGAFQCFNFVRADYEGLKLRPIAVSFLENRMVDELGPLTRAPHLVK